MDVCRRAFAWLVGLTVLVAAMVVAPATATATAPPPTEPAPAETAPPPPETAPPDTAPPDTAPPPPPDEGAATGVACPNVGAFPPLNRTYRPGDAGGQLECTYIQAGTNINSINISWDAAGSAAGTYCRPIDGTVDTASESSSNSLFGRAFGTASVRASISFNRSEPGAPLADWLVAAETLLAAIEPGAEPCPPLVPCAPTVGELTLDQFDPPAPGMAAPSQVAGGWELSCSYAVPEGRADLSRLALTVLYTPANAEERAAYTACLAENEFSAGIHIIDGPGTSAIRGRITAFNPHLAYDAVGAEAAVVAMQNALVPLAKDCAPLTLPELYTPLPSWLAAELDPADTEGTPTLAVSPGGATELLVEPFTGQVEAATAAEQPAATTPAADEPTGSPTATETGVESSEGQADSPNAVVASDDDGPPGWLTLSLRVFGWIALALSILGLALALFLIRRESRVRPVWDVVRIVIMVAVAIATTLILGRSTPLPVVIVALAVGVTLGLVQGRNLDVRVDGRKVFARRSTWAIVAFIVGLACSQLSGLLSRLGMLSVGIGLTVLSASLATGIVVGRRQSITSARAAAVATVIAIVVLPIAALAFGGDARSVDASAPDDTTGSEPGAPPADQPEGTLQDVDALLADMVDWTTVRLDGGYLSTFGAPPVEVALPAGLATVPEPVTFDRTFTADLAGTPVTYTAQETYTFALGEDGTCCAASYAIAGTEQRGDLAAEAIQGTADLGEVIGGVEQNFSSRPFGEQEYLRDDSCGRKVGGNRDFGADPVYTSLLVGASDRSGQTAPPLNIYSACELAGFDALTALSLAPPPPAADDPVRQDSFPVPTGVACPVFQEVYQVLDDPRFGGQGRTGDIDRLYRDPNGVACSGSMNPGDERKGGVRNEFQFDLATADPAIEAARQQDARDDFDTRTMPWDIDPAEQCVVDENGIPRNGPDQTSCLNRSFHRFGGGQITIWTNTAFADGPDTIIRGTFPWGHYLYNCHHCEVGDPFIAQTVSRWHEFARIWNETGMLPEQATAAAADANAAATTVPADEEEATDDATDDPEPAEQEEEATDEDADAAPDDETQGEDDDVSAGDAAAVALIGLLGAAGIAATTIVESGHSGRELLDAYREGGADAVGDLLDVDLEEPELPTDIVSGWDPYQETFRDMTRAERERMEEIDRGIQRRGRLERYGRERAANRAPREELEAFIANSNRRDEIQAALDAANEERARWEDPEYVERVIREEAYDGMLRDLEGLPGEARQLGRAINREMNDPENWRILRETLRDTAYDTAGLMSPVEFGDGRQHLQQSARQAGQLGSTLAQAFARDPVGFVFEMSPAADVRDALDPDRTLGQRFASLGAALAELFPAMGGASMARDASRLGEAARDLDRTLDAAQSARAGERVLDGTGAVRDADRALDGTGAVRDADRAIDRTEDTLESAVDTQRAEARARAVERIDETATHVPDSGPPSTRAADRVEQQIERNRAALADELGSPAEQARREAWEANRRAGAAAVDDFADIADPIDDLGLSPAELADRRREAALRVQTNKQGLQDMKGQPPEVRGAFIEEMRAVYDETDGKMRDWAVDYVNRQETGRLAGVEIKGELRLDRVEGGRRIYVDDVGNEIQLFEPTNAKDPLAVGADRDFTMYVRPANSDGPAFSLPRDEVRPVYNDHFYDAIGGDEMRERLGIPEVTADDVLADAQRRGVDPPADPEAVARRQTRDAMAERLDQAVTDDLDPEAYRNVNTVVNRPYGEIGDSQQVGLTMTHKGEEWQWRADHSTDRIVGGDGSAGGGVRWSELSEDQRAEGIRQIVKQNGNQIQPRQQALQRQVEYLIERGDLPADTPIPKPDHRLDQAMEIMSTVKNDGVAPVDMERRLLRTTGMTPSDVARRAGERLEVMERLRPPEVRDLQRRMDSMADEMKSLMGREPTQEEVWMWLADEGLQ